MCLTGRERLLSVKLQQMVSKMHKDARAFIMSASCHSGRHAYLPYVIKDGSHTLETKQWELNLNKASGKGGHAIFLAGCPHDSVSYVNLYMNGQENSHRTAIQQKYDDHVAEEKAGHQLTKSFTFAMVERATIKDALVRARKDVRELNGFTPDQTNKMMTGEVTRMTFFGVPGTPSSGTAPSSIRTTVTDGVTEHDRIKTTTSGAGKNLQAKLTLSGGQAVLGFTRGRRGTGYKVGDTVEFVTENIMYKARVDSIGQTKVGIPILRSNFKFADDLTFEQFFDGKYTPTD